MYLILAFVILSPLCIAKLMNVKRLRQNESDRLQFQNLSEEEKNEILSKRVRSRKMFSCVLTVLLLIFLALLFITFFRYMLLLGYTDPDLFIKALLVASLIITILLIFGLLLLNYKVPIEEINYRKAEVNKKYKTDENALSNENINESEVIRKRQKGGIIAFIIIVLGALLFSII